ncbi:uncharacterized protein KGF55_002905 [Candida pseudojiufengensis]|uniref:uncharacterized protein n=1 Tax=Candida pseudojiufengensis TaxID=497109 RepID=UPI002224796E|nr:uncharacterized protein KGF55_002905 [Candida pseudojiufengensis]KAI5963113.1 hypothetical protein KGF55_002905 [Candida pseudojiufengensis]
MNQITRILSKTRDVLWGVPPSDPKARRYLFKLDVFVLTYVCLLYFCNFLDRQAYSSSYLSGMAEDLNMIKKDFNIGNTIFYVGFVISMVPHNLMMLKVRPRYWLTFCAGTWSILTLINFRLNHFYQLCILRFFQGTFESCIFGGVHLMLGTYYPNKKDLVIRTFVFTASGLVGQLFSGVIQAAVHSNLDGKQGLAGWRWLYIMDFIISFPIVIYGFIFFPDSPDIAKPFYFTEEEHQMALKNMKKPTHDKFDKQLLKRVFGRWHWYLFSMLWITGASNEAFASNSILGLWLKYYDYSISDRNHIPMGVYAVGVVSTGIAAYYIKNVGNGKNHWHMNLAVAIIMIVSPILQLCKPFNTSFVFAAQFLGGASYAAQTVSFAWANIVCADDLQERAIVISSMNMLGNTMNAWWSIVFFGADTAPRFRNGSIALLSTAIATIFVVLAIAYLHKRDEDRIGGLVEQIDEEEVIEGIEKEIDSSIERKY